MKKNGLNIMLAAFVVIYLASCGGKMTMKEAINFNDNVIFCVDDMEKGQVKFINTNYENKDITEEVVTKGFDKLTKEGLDYKDELKEVFKDYRHSACKKLKNAFYTFADEIAEVNKENKEKILRRVKEYRSFVASNDSTQSEVIFGKLKEELLKFHEETKPAYDKFFKAHDEYVAETGITLKK